MYYRNMHEENLFAPARCLVAIRRVKLAFILFYKYVASTTLVTKLVASVMYFYPCCCVFPRFFYSQEHVQLASVALYSS